VNGQTLRDEGIHRVIKGETPQWKAAVQKVIFEFPVGWEGIFEEIRLEAERAGFRAKSSNSWGSACMTALRLGVLEVRLPLAMGHMIDPKGHARKSQVLRRTDLI
jgi:hypothetical protein